MWTIKAMSRRSKELLRFGHQIRVVPAKTAMRPLDNTTRPRLKLEMRFQTLVMSVAVGGDSWRSVVRRGATLENY